MRFSHRDTGADDAIGKFRSAVIVCERRVGAIEEDGGDERPLVKRKSAPDSF